jgi:hypothetical protein
MSVMIRKENIVVLGTLHIKFLRRKATKVFLKGYGPILLEECLTGEYIFISMRFSKGGLLIIGQIILIYEKFFKL